MIPGAEQFYFKDSLYTPYEIEEEDLNDLFYLIYSNSDIDSYCPFCKKDTLFKSNPIDRPKKNDISSFNDTIFSFKDFSEKYSMSHFTGKKDFVMKYKCMRSEHSHVISFYSRVEDKKVFKIGQYPSVADITESVITKKYANLLDKKVIAEFNKAIGLYSHGVGIGSFVYLRRIFENLIYETHNEVKNKVAGWDEQLFKSSRMDKKIEMLSSYLPIFLVEHRNIYGILSKGIHQLAEEECKSLFPVVQAGIEIILDEKIAKKEQDRKAKETSMLIKKFNSSPNDNSK